MSLFRKRDSAPVDLRSLSFQDVWGSDYQSPGNPLGSTVATGLRLAPLFSAVRLIADQVSCTPIIAYQVQPDGSKRPMLRPPPLLAQPSARDLLPTWIFKVMVSLLTRGNAVGLITSVDRGGWPTGLEWLNPDDCSVNDSDPAKPVFSYLGRVLETGTFVHITSFAMPGKSWGLSPLNAFATMLSTGANAQKSADDFYKNGTHPSSHFRNTGKTLTADEASSAKARYKASVLSGDVLVTGNDWSLESIGLPPDQARFIETIRATATQIAAIYSVSPEWIGGEVANSLTYKNVEQDMTRFVTLALRPYFVRIEEALTAVLPRGQLARFNIDSLVRADLLTRMQAHEIALRAGLETNTEGRQVEDMPPLTDEQKVDWQNNYRANQAPTPPPAM